MTAVSSPFPCSPRSFITVERISFEQKPARLSPADTQVQWDVFYHLFKALSEARGWVGEGALVFSGVVYQIQLSTRFKLGNTLRPISHCFWIYAFVVEFFLRNCTSNFRTSNGICSKCQTRCFFPPIQQCASAMRTLGVVKAICVCFCLALVEWIMLYWCLQRWNCWRCRSIKAWPGPANLLGLLSGKQGKNHTGKTNVTYSCLWSWLLITLPDISGRYRIPRKLLLCKHWHECLNFEIWTDTLVEELLSFKSLFVHKMRDWLCLTI